MPLILTAFPSDAAPQRLLLRDGQRATVGRAAWADLCLPQDAELAEEHFFVHRECEWVARSLDASPLLQIGQQRVKQVTFSDERQLRYPFVAGRTRFEVERRHESSPSKPIVDRVVDVALPDDEPRTDDSQSILVAAETMNVSRDARDMIEQPDRVVAYLRRLHEAEFFEDCARVAACLLPAVEAVKWVMDGLQDRVALSRPIIVTIAEWTVEPSETTRRDVRARQPAANDNPLLHWLAQSVVFSGGSLAPDGQPVVAPPAHLVAIALVTTIRWDLATGGSTVASMQDWSSSAVAHTVRYFGTDTSKKDR